MADVIATFSTLYFALSPNGVYMVEDMHTAYWEEYGGGVGRNGSFIESGKFLVDKLNARHSRGSIETDEFARSTWAINFYDSVVVFERGRQTPTHAPVIGKTIS
jgi:hypothetical protein